MDLQSCTSGSLRPSCEAGVPLPASTSLKWAPDGELTDVDLHHVLVRLCAHDPQACEALVDIGAPPA